MIPWTFPGMVVRREDIPGFARTFRDIFLVWSFRLSQYSRCMFPGIGAWDITRMDRGQHVERTCENVERPPGNVERPPGNVDRTWTGGTLIQRQFAPPATKPFPSMGESVFLV